MNNPVNFVDPSGRVAVPIEPELKLRLVEWVLALIGATAVATYNAVSSSTNITLPSITLPSIPVSGPATSISINTPGGAHSIAMAGGLATVLSMQWGAVARVDRAEAKAVVKQIIASGQTPIFRMGSGNATNFTPREGEAALSFTLAMPTSGQFSITTLELVNATGVLMAVVDGANHVSVYPTNAADLATWQASRPTALETPHFLTLLLQSLSLRVR